MIIDGDEAARHPDRSSIFQKFCFLMVQPNSSIQLFLECCASLKQPSVEQCQHF